MEKRSNLWVTIFFFVTALYLFLAAAPGFHESFFSIDDNGLFNQAYLKHPWTWQSLKVIWTPGYSADYYPVRDLSVWLDWSFAKDLNADTTVPKVQNILWLLGIAGLLFFLLKKLTQQTLLSALIACAWLMHPFHMESVHWISARKDLMAWFFTLASVLSFLRVKEGSRVSILWVSLFFVCGLLSKATFLALPFAVVTWMCWEKFVTRKKFEKDVWTTLFLTCGISVILVLVNYWNYTQSNFMQMTESNGVRLLSVAAAFGRSIVGIFVPSVNAIDVEPWGGWYLYNKIFIPFGIVGVLLIAGLTIWALKNRRSGWILFTLILLSILVMTPGFNPKHRNFYSIRYFEPIFFVLVVGAGVLLSRVRWNKQIAAGAFFIVGIMLAFDSSNWHSNLAMMKKSYELTSSDPSLRTMLLYEYFNTDTWGRLSPEEVKEFEELYRLQVGDCLTAESPNPRCLAFYPKIGNFMQRFPVKNPEESLRIREKAFRDITKMKGAIFSDVAEAELAWSRFHYRLQLGEIDQQALQQYFAWHTTMTDDFTRVRYLVLQCLEVGPGESQRISQKWQSEYILDHSEVDEFISQIRIPEVRQKLQTCLIPPKTPSGS